MHAPTDFPVYCIFVSIGLVASPVNISVLRCCVYILRGYVDRLDETEWWAVSNLSRLGCTITSSFQTLDGPRGTGLLEFWKFLSAGLCWWAEWVNCCWHSAVVSCLLSSFLTLNDPCGIGLLEFWKFLSTGLCWWTEWVNCCWHSVEVSCLLSSLSGWDAQCWEIYCMSAFFLLCSRLPQSCQQQSTNERCDGWYIYSWPFSSPSTDRAIPRVISRVNWRHGSLSSGPSAWPLSLLRTPLQAQQFS